MKRIPGKIWFCLFGGMWLCLVVTSQLFGQVFFVNRTESMPRGIYLKSSNNKLGVADTIVLKINGFNGNLIKYVAAIYPSEWCADENGTIWVDGKFFAQMNIEKYPAKKPNHSECQSLKPDDLFVIGDHPNSYDSRYFGVIKSENVVALVELLWSFK